MKRLPRKLWRVVRKNGTHSTFEDEATMQSLVASDATVKIGLYELVEEYIAVKKTVFERKAVRKQRR